MDTQILDQILTAYFTLLDVGFARLLPIGLGILALVTVFELRLAFMHAAIDGYIDFVRLFGLAFMPLLTAAILAYFMQHAETWTAEAMQMFLTWGTSVVSVHIGNNPITSVLSSPSALFTLGFELAQPLWDFMIAARSFLVQDGWFIIATYLLCWFGIVIVFALIALDVMAVLLEFKVAAISSLVMMAWGALRHTSFLMWVSWQWIASVGVKLFVLVMVLSGAIVAIGLLSPLHISATRDPTVTEAVVLLVAVIILGSFCHTIPSIAASRVSGESVSGRSLLWAALIPMATMRAGSQVVRGFSNLVR